MAYTNIDDPSAYFQTALYTGNGTANTSITNDGNSNLQPDWIWIKRRDGTADHNSFDSSRGTGKHLAQNQTQAEQTVNGVTAFNSDGFELSTNGDSNFNGATFVAWQWKANGGTTSTDTTSSITSTVQVNSDAGFSIVTYTGDGTTTGGFGHGLGVAPSVVFVKRRNTAADWCVYHKGIGADYFVKLNTTDAQASGVWQGIAPSSTRVTVYQGGLVNGNNDTYVAYCFAEKQGYSKFGSYVGNGSDNGPFIYTGFKPAFVVTKGTHASQWRLYDSARSPNNVNINRLFPYTSIAEQTDTDAGIDMLSNGFKIRGSGGDYNASGQAYIYMAFADNPFVTSTGIPTTAR